MHSALGQLERALPDLASARVDPDDALAEAASVYASILIAAGTPDLAPPWADLAQRVYGTGLGPPTAAALQAESVLGQVWTSLGMHDRAVEVYADLAHRLPAYLGPDHRQVFNGTADYAAALHRVSHCAVARTLLADCCRAHVAIFGPEDRDGIKMLARLGAMTRDCQDFDGAHAQFTEARARCRAYLADDDPLTANVTRLARADADPGHECEPDEPRRPAKATFGRRRRWPSR